ncbi:MAG TPA: hypothetical protein PKH65_07110 [Bacteroidia bacterium]|nr:hypothetical protein [Bacteroidia bacterium]
MNETEKRLKQLEDGSITIKEFMTSLGPGCEYTKWDERRTVLVPDKPVEHQIRTCREVKNCDDPAQNVPKNCSEWTKEW